MNRITTDYVSGFVAELNKIDQLESTPNLIRGAAINSIDNAIQAEVSNTTRKKLENAKKSLENIKDSSMSQSFKVIYSQMCVLAVSSLEATLKRYFVNRLNDARNINQKSKKVLDIKVSFAEILENELKFGGKTGSLILDKAQLNFQDLGAIIRNFEEYANKEIDLDNETKKRVCFYLEARHVLVHKGGKVDDKLLYATNTMSANLKNYALGDEVELDSLDWKNIKSSFTKLVEITTKPQEEKNEIAI